MTITPIQGVKLFAQLFLITIWLNKLVCYCYVVVQLLMHNLQCLLTHTLLLDFPTLGKNLLIRKIVRKISPHNQLFHWKTYQSSERTKATKGISGKVKNLGNFSGWSNILVTHISSPYQYFDPTFISRRGSQVGDLQIQKNNDWRPQRQFS